MIINGHNFSYIGSANNGVKHKKAENFNEVVYSIFLAPAKLSGYEVCPKRNNECTLLCLNESGKNKLDRTERINNSRINKTKLFFENRHLFMTIVISEIKLQKELAKLNNQKFSVRLNNTSDLSPELFYIIENGVKKNLLEIFPDVQFYDYTKVANRVKLLKKYPNYDLTYSFDGYNMDICKEMLSNNIRVAMVFKNVPDNFEGITVIDGDSYDMRYYDPKNVIVGLKYKFVRSKLPIESKFVIQ